MKSKIAILFFVSSFMLFSCSGENLYEFEELSQKEDFIVQVAAISKTEEQPMAFKATFYETDGYGDVFESKQSYGSLAPFGVLNNAVKEYEKVGVKVLPQQNIQAIQVRIFNLETGNDVLVRYFEDPEEVVSVYYNFETSEETVL